MNTRPAQWIDAQATDLLDTDAAIREAVRRVRFAPRDWTTARPPTASTPTALGAPSVTISVREARTMLRAALPAPIAPFRGRARQQHAELVTALSLFTSHLAGLAAGDHATVHKVNRHMIGSGLQLADALAAWLAEMRWIQATKAAKKHWPKAQRTGSPGSIIEVLQQPTPADAEHAANTEPRPGRAA